MHIIILYIIHIYTQQCVDNDRFLSPNRQMGIYHLYHIYKNLSRLSYFHASLSLKTHLLKLHHIMFQNGGYLTIVDGDSIYSFNIDLFTTIQSTVSLMLIRHGFSCMIKEAKYETKNLLSFFLCNI